MKQIILLLSILVSLTAFNQTVVSYREAALNDSQSYTLDGIAFIEELSNGTFRFRLDGNYSTQSGPDVQIFMTNNTGFSSPINTTGALFVEDVGTGAGGINHFSGAYSTILSGIASLSDFDHVVFTCVGFGFLHWGDGSFGAIVTPCATTMSSLTESVCGSYTAPSGQIFTSSGTITDVISNVAGCDSIITIDLTVTNVNVATTMIDSIVTATAVGATYQWINCSTMNSIVVGATNQSYTITDTDSYAVIVTQGGCSNTSSCVNYCAPTFSSLTESVCGSYMAPSGQVFTSSGTITDVITNAVGCDSIITIDLTVTTVNIATTMIDNSVTATAIGASYQWINCSAMNAIVVGETNQSYTITDTDSYAVIVTQGGCSNMSSCVNYCIETTSSLVETVCGSYTAPSGNIFTSTGIITDTISNVLGCDSIITIDLTVNTVDVTTSILDSQITATATGATYQWVNCSTTNTEVVGETNQNYTVTDTDSYAVIVTQNGCSDTSSCETIVFTGVEENSFGFDIRIHPNPTNNNTIIDLGELKNVLITVIDVTGKIVYSENNGVNTQVNLNTTSFNNGLYFVNIKSDKGQRVFKLIKE
jgi:hypothetical protein